jgi:hypothetical protein
MYVVMKAVIGEDNTITADSSFNTTRVRADYEKAIDELGAWHGDVFVVWNVGDLHVAQHMKALDRAREGSPERVLVGCRTADNKVLMLPLHEDYRDGRIGIGEIDGRKYLD